MTQVAQPPVPAGGPPERPVPEGHVRLEIDGVVVDAPKGELIIRTAERLGTAIPRFCDHPLLEPVGACRQCLVEVEMGGRPMPKPQAACTQPVADGMVVRTQVSSPVAEKAQRSNLEFLLLNHPLDCPICDKGGECPLQNQSMANGAPESRLHDHKRVFTKPVPVSTQVLLDRERCVLCQRCTRFSEQIAGDKFIDLLERGGKQQIGINAAEPFQSYFSGNTIQICPVGALTSTAYRFRSRPFDLVSTDTVCEHCSSGCSLRTDHRSGTVLRRLAGTDPEVNEEWNCDKGRFAFVYQQAPDRITRPLVRSATTGELEPVSWSEALAAAAAGLTAAREAGGVGVLAGGRLTVTDAYAYAKFARVALRTNDVDFRARAHSAEEADFLTRHVLGRTPATGGITYRDLESAPVVALLALEPEEESPILFLRLRKAARQGVRVVSVGAVHTRSLSKLHGTLIPTLPGDEVSALDGSRELAEALDTPGSVLLVGERAAEVPGALTAAAALAERTGARLAWVPRRAGERGALEAGALPGLLPGGHPVADPAARAHVAEIWGAPLPSTPGRDTTGILQAAASGALGGLLVGGVDPEDLPDPAAAVAAISAAGFVVSLEQRPSSVTVLADVVLPVAAVAEKSGAFLDWEGRLRPFDAAVPAPGRLDDARILDTLGVEMDVDLYTQTPVAARADLARLGRWSGPLPAAASGTTEDAEDGAEEQGHESAAPADALGLRLVSWRMNLDQGSLQAGEPHLAGTARPTVARLSRTEAARRGLTDGDVVTIVGPAGSLTLPLVVTTMVDGAVWVPGRVDGRNTGAVLGAGTGTLVRLAGREGVA